MNHNPLVSIITRTKDRPKLLRKAMQSVARQTYRPIEVVLVNDGGCDPDLHDLRRILRGIDLNYIRLKTHTGRAGAGNMGIENAKGKYTGFLDDDDEYYPEHVATLVSFLEQSDYEVAYTDSVMAYREYNPDAREFDESDKELVFSQDFSFDKLVFENYMPFMCLLFKKDTLAYSGGFDEGLELYEDWDLLLRIGDKYPFYHIKQVTAVYNQWSADLQISQRNSDILFLQQSYMRVIAKHADKINPKRVHGIISDYVRTKQALKALKNESESQRTILSENASKMATLSSEIQSKDAAMISLRGQSADAVRHIELLSAGKAEGDLQIRELTGRLEEKISRLNALEAEMREQYARTGALTAQLQEKDVRINTLANELNERVSRVSAFEGKLKERDERIAALSEDRVSRIGELENELTECKSRFRILATEKDGNILHLRNELRSREDLVEEMKNTRGWRLLEKYRKIRDRIFPARH